MRTVLSTLTTRGRAFLSAGVTSVLCAIILGQRDLMRVGLLMLLLPVITAWFTQRARFLISCVREISPARLEAGQSATVRLHVENPGRIPTGLILLEDQVPYVLGSRPRFVIDQLRPRWHRAMDYQVHSEVRGRYRIGPLSVQMTDPFGFVELTRTFASQASLVVTPPVTPLAPIRLSGDWSGTGENRPRAFASAGTEDVTVREYRLGDDLRRVHWRSTARTGELMVRREEQPHQSRATLVLDRREGAHRGIGPASSFEYAVSATASIGTHLASQQFVIRMVGDELTGEAAGWHDRGINSPAEIQLLLDALAVVQTRAHHELSTGNEQHSSGVVVAVLGSVTPTDAAALGRIRAGSTRSLALLLDVQAWSRNGNETMTSTAAEQAEMLRGQGWAVVVAGPGDALGPLWHELGSSLRAGARHFHGSVTRAAALAPQGPAA